MIASRTGVLVSHISSGMVASREESDLGVEVEGMGSAKFSRRDSTSEDALVFHSGLPLRKVINHEATKEK